jgi:isoaspartyl peptidase/L-asparaginase-like protein (Ntn-hydrolase superfamily)
MPTVLSTWSFGPLASQAALAALASGASALDAAVAGASVVELDPKVDSVGVGGLPDASGRVSLDASVMQSPARCGAVSFVRGYANVAEIARCVMDRTVHVMLSGEGAEAFAARQGFQKHADDLLTNESRAAFKAWIDARASRARAGQFVPPQREGELPPMNVEERYAQAGSGSPPRAGSSLPEPSHDTVCLLVRDDQHRLAGVCTTSGLGFKVPGRVGDSPIIGGGLYVDPRFGGASCTGNGELIMTVCGSFLAVEQLRQGKTALQAARCVIERIIEQHEILPSHQAAIIVMAADGSWASASLRPGFSHCISDERGTRLEPAQWIALDSPAA